MTRAEAVALVAVQLQTNALLVAVKHSLDGVPRASTPNAAVQSYFQQADDILDAAERYADP